MAAGMTQETCQDGDLQTDTPYKRISGLRFMFAGAKPNNKTIFSVIKKEKEQPATGLIYIFLGYL